MTPELPLAADVALVGAAAVFWIAAVRLGPDWRITAATYLAQLDLGAAAFGRLNHAHTLNTLRIAAIPVLVLGRDAPRLFLPLGRSRWTAWLYSAFVAYVAATCLWTPFRAAGVKLVGYLAVFGLTYLVMVALGRAGLVTRTVCRRAAVVTIALGLLQTVALNNPYGTLEKRFTGFCSPQSYAILLVALVVALVAAREPAARSDWALVGGLGVVLVLDGSREFTAALALALIAFGAWRAWPYVRRALQRPSRRALAISAGVGVGAVGLAAVALWVLPAHLPSSRLGAAVLSIEGSSKAPSTATGTLTFRTNMWHQLLHDYEHLPPSKQAFGAGAAAGGRVAVEAMPNSYSLQTVDANRVIHSEYLRTLFEFGVAGALLFGAMLLAFVTSWVRLASRRSALLPMVLLMPTIFIGLGFENMFAEGVSAAGLGCWLVAAVSAWPGLRADEDFAPSAGTQPDLEVRSIP